MRTKTAIVIPSQGIGDALLMMIASHRLLQKGYHTITLHPALPELADWFPGHTLQAAADLAEADLLIIENDNSPKIKLLLKKHRKETSIFYPSYVEGKHPRLADKDQVFDRKKPMAENVATSIAKLLKSREVSKSNGLTPPPHLIHRLCKDRVVIHPTSSKREKNWSPAKFLKLANQLKLLGFAPAFAVSKAERPDWIEVQHQGFECPLFENLSELAGYIYESGYLIGNDSLIGHLASNLHLPTVIIADCEKRMELWRPGWLQGAVVTPPAWIPNWKFLRLRRWKWKSLITSERVLAAFESLIQ